jgi:hypothetical protein
MIIARSRSSAALLRGFTMVEVPIVIATIAFLNHEAARKNFPAGTKIWVKGPVIGQGKSEWAFHSFMPDLLPYLEQQQVADRYHQRKMFSASENAEAITAVVRAAVTPGN